MDGNKVRYIFIDRNIIFIYSAYAPKYYTEKMVEPKIKHAMIVY